jgi:hypothetical protein
MRTNGSGVYLSRVLARHAEYSYGHAADRIEMSDHVCVTLRVTNVGTLGGVCHTAAVADILEAGHIESNTRDRLSSRSPNSCEMS